MSKKERVSFDPRKLAAGGGLLDDVNVEFTECRFEMFDYGGKAPEAPSFHAKLVDIDDGEEHEQYWSIGKASDWEIIEDGAALYPAGKKVKAVNVSSNFGQLLVSLGNAGFPSEIMDKGSVFALNGLKAHVIRVEMKRKGLKRSAEQEEKGYEQTCLTVDEIIALPGEAASAAAETQAASEDEVVEAAVKFVTGVMGDEGVAKKDLPKLAFDKIKDEDARNAILEYIFSDEFLKEHFNLTKGVITTK